MKKVLFVFVLFVLIIQGASAQQGEETVVRLMNGSVVIGQMTDQGDGKLYIETANGSIVYFTRRAIKEIGTQPATARLRYYRNPVTVYLQNGSVIIGQLTELPEDNRVKIETANRSVVYFTDKSIKEVVAGVEAPSKPAAVEEEIMTPTRRRSTTSRPDRNTASRSTSTTPERISSTRTQPSRTAATRATEVEPIAEAVSGSGSGYRGFLEAGYVMKMGDISTSRIEVTTSHGYQVNPSFFIGVGVGVNLYSDGLHYKGKHIENVDTFNIATTIPIFADLRYNFLESGKAIPFIGLKAGYSIGFSDSEFTSSGTDGSTKKTTETKMEGVGFYLAPSVGIKYFVSPSFALNFSLGYTAQMFDYTYMFDGDPNIYSKSKNNGGISIKVGVEF
ncbi:MULTISPECIES: hypothetical protein [unclassified Parabacteroides]|uniref:hypothetical protein n=1 Tax=unclassified Parabacteroides TaxID=2649774 RepID=UPI002472E989|nr:MULTISPECIES: hypothetical protein [unclassified Parabacteroides]